MDETQTPSPEQPDDDAPQADVAAQAVTEQPDTAETQTERPDPAETGTVVQADADVSADAAPAQTEQPTPQLPHAGTSAQDLPDQQSQPGPRRPAEAQYQPHERTSTHNHGPGQSGPQYDGPGPNGPQYHGPGPNGPQYHGPGQNGPQYHGPGQSDPYRQAGPGPQPGPVPGAGGDRTSPLHSFFSSVRRTGLFRSEERWVGGVAGGLARRLGVDPVLVRSVWGLLGLVSGIGLVIYGLAWALLPEERDGRIHVEQALVGDINTGLAGAIVAVITGFGLGKYGIVPSWFVQGWIGSSLGGFVVTVFWVGTLLLALWAMYLHRTGSGARPNAEPRHTPHPGPAGPGTGTDAGRPGTPPSAAGHPAGPFATGSDPVPSVPVSGPVPSGSTGSGSTATWPSAALAFAQPDTASTVRVTPSSSGSHDGQAPEQTDTTASFHTPARPVDATASFHTPTGPADAPSSGRWSSSLAGPSPYVSQHTPPAWSAPTPVPTTFHYVPGPGRTLSLITLAVSMFGLAAVVWAYSIGRLSPIGALITCTGLLTAVLGLGVVISALRGRRGGWMSVTGFLVLLAAVPSLVTGSVIGGFGSINGTFPHRTVDITVTDAMLEQAGGHLDLGEYAVGDITLDLRGVSAAAARDADIDISMGAGQLRIKTLQGQAVSVDAQVGAGELRGVLTQPWSTTGVGTGRPRDPSWEPMYSVSGQSLTESYIYQGGIGIDAQMSSPDAQAVGPAHDLDVDVEVGIGEIQVYEEPDQVTWSGWKYDSYWVVDSWREPGGEERSGDEGPVPGMTFPAVSDRDVQQCADQVSDAQDGSAADSSWSGEPSDLDDLPGGVRAQLDSCLLDRATQRGSTDGGSAQRPDNTTASPEATATPSR